MFPLKKKKNSIHHFEIGTHFYHKRFTIIVFITVSDIGIVKFK